jgi:hypothetical protein
VAGLIWVGSPEPAAAQAYNGGPNQVIVNMDVLNGLPGGYGAGYGAPAQPYGAAPKSQFLPGTAPQGYAAAPTQPGTAPLGAPRYLPPYTPYGMAGAEAPLPLAPGLVGLATPPARQPSSVLTTLGPDGRPIQPIKLKQPGSGTKQASKPKKKEYAAPAQPAPTETASAPEPTPEPAPEPEQIATIEPPVAPEPVPETVPMPEATPAPAESSATVESAPAVAAPEPSAEEVPAAPAEEQAAAPEVPEVPAPEATTPEAPAAETSVAAVTPEAPTATTAASDPEPLEEQAPTEEGATEEAAPEAAAEPDNSQPAAPIPQGGIRIVFPSEVNDVPSEANAALDDLAGQMLADENMRIQIKCYASGTADTESKARRKSLARCINIRQYLFKKDVRTTRMDVRALGLKSEGQPADRVDIVPPES